MKERPILFTPDNIRRIVSGVKTQTRRAILKQPEMVDLEPRYEKHTWGFWGGEWPDNGRVVRTSPYGMVGDRLYIKEGVITHASIPQLIGYYIDGCRVTEHWEKRLTAMFMPKWAARTWLEITEVRIDRLQDISEEDAEAEGVTEDMLNAAAISLQLRREWIPNRPWACGFRYLWDSINKKKHPWSSNPWVFALTFKKL